MNETNNSFCEYLSKFLIPHLYNDLKLNGHANLASLLNSISHEPAISENCLNEINAYNKLAFLSYAKDLTRYFTLCNQFESNFFYAFWLLNLFKPLVITLSITLFLLPAIIVVFIYACALFLFLSKHWNKLKVSENKNNEIISLFCHPCCF